MSNRVVCAGPSRPPLHGHDPRDPARWEARLREHRAVRLSGGRLLLSPSDVVEAVACSHRAVTAFRAAHGVAAPAADAGPSEAVARAGDVHERAVVAALRAAGHAVVDLSCATADLDAWALLAERTLAHCRAGTADVLLQGGLLDERSEVAALVGRPDLLVRTSRGWRVEDAKLARSLEPSALLQTMLYRDALAGAGVPVHDDVRLHLGSGEVLDVPARSAGAWARRQLAEVTALLAALPARGALTAGFVAQVEWCSTCEPDSPCGRQRAAQDHLGGVADLRRDQARRLVAAGIHTLAQLAAADGPVRGMASATFEALREQAGLQLAARTGGEVPVRVRPHPRSVRASDVRPGLWSLPDPDPGDVFFDMEGDPLYSSGAGGRDAFGLEYLFGATHDGPSFTAFWGHDRVGERAAFTAFVDWVQARRETHPGLHVHHYAPYERSALARLAAQHATRGDVVDAWLREGVLVDLYQVVRRGLRAGVPSYSIKKIERLYGAEHTGDVATAGESIEQYEAYRTTGDETLLKQIEDYNRLDCESTWRLRDYLLALRLAAVDAGTIAPLEVERSDGSEGGDGAGKDGAAGEGAAGAGAAPAPTPRALLRQDLAQAAEALLAGADPGAPTDEPEPEARRVLAGLLGAAVREEKAAWQDVFRIAGDLATEGAAAAVDDPGVLGGLQLVGGCTGPRGAVEWTFTAPAQEHRVEVGPVLACVGAAPLDARVTRLEGDDQGLVVTVAVSAAKAAAGGWGAAAAPGLDALMPSGFVSAEPLQRSLLDLAGVVAAHGALAPGGPRAAGRALLAGRPSLALDALPPPAPGEDAVDHAVRLARGAPGLVIAVQGPPGAGKSHLGSRVVDALVADARASGRAVRIGVTANSHAVVRHLLAAVHRRTPGAVVRHKGGPKGGKDPATWERLCTDEPCASPALATTHRDGWAAGEVLGGTAWAFAPPDSPQLDLLVVDEAGQMGLGDVLAASRNARSVLLLGDPQQLAKPSRAAHPPGVGVSALGHLMGGRATMPPGTGIFLGATWRMHADVAGFISEISYDGRLVAHGSCAERAVLPLDPFVDASADRCADPFAGTGLRYVPVAHEGNAQGSEEECAAVVEVARELLRRRWASAGAVAPVTASDVLVVSPFTVQVRRLRAALDAAGLGGVAVGTVDRFQGQEAVAVVYSTASSDADAAPRGLGFLYDTHRLNVAVSRAKCLAFWVGSPELLRPRVAAAHQVPLVDAHCRFVEGARLVQLPLAAVGAPARGW